LFGWFFKKDEWCCSSFRDLYEARCGRRLFVFVRPARWGGCQLPSFWLAFRSVRHQDLSRFSAAGLPPDLPLTISTSLRIIRCPWCGIDLDEFYKGRSAELVDPVILREFELPITDPGSPT
jgi:hypothetical protein